MPLSKKEVASFVHQKLLNNLRRNALISYSNWCSYLYASIFKTCELYFADIS